jgi:hypothetical protein
MISFIIKSDSYLVEIMNVRYSILFILVLLILFYHVNQEGFVNAETAVTGTTRNCVSKETTEPTFLCQAKEYLSSFISGYNNTTNFKYTCCNVKDGEQGPRGTKGPIGMKGLAGPLGEKGLIGEIGDSKMGPTGAVGPVGPVGKIGLKGVDDDITEVGPIGPQGDMGPAGDAGPPGPQGPDGLAEKNKEVIEKNDPVLEKNEPVVITNPNDIDDRAMNLKGIQKNIRNFLSSKNKEVGNSSSKSPSLAQGNEYKKSVISS